MIHVLTLIIVIALAAPSVFAEKVRVCVPKLDSHRTAVLDRIFYPIVEEIAKNETWQLEKMYIHPDSIEAQIYHQTCDLAIGISATTDIRESGLILNREFIVSTWAQIYHLRGNQIHSYQDLNGRWIGFVKGSPYIDAFDQFALPLDLQYRKIILKSEEAVVQALLSGWIDVAVFDRLHERELLEKFPIEKSTLMFSPIELKIAVAPCQAARLESIDYHLRLMKRDPHSSYSEIIRSFLYSPRENWLRANFHLILTGLGSALGILFIFILFLRMQVKRKTIALHEKNEALQSEVQRHCQTQEALTASHQLLERTMDCMQEGLLLVDIGSEETILTNQYALRILGYDEESLLQESPADLFSIAEEVNDKKAEFHDLAVKDRLVRREVTMRKRNGEQFPGEVTITPFCDTDSKSHYWVMTFRDITERKSLQQSESRWRQAQKMEAIGTLAGGIAHDFNNLLTPIMGYAQLLENDFGKEDENITFYIDQIQNAGKRARSLTQQILAFSRGQDAERQKVSVLNIMQEALKLLRASLPSTVEIRLHVDTLQDQVFADSTQIHQLIMNLCTNAAQAMPYGGVLDLELSDEMADNPDVYIGTDPDDRDFVRLTIRDSGTGIPSDILYRIFDPFFTTKEQGEGTGLGLSVVHGIVMEYEGAIGVKSVINKGTAFHIYLPLAEMETHMELVETMEESYGLNAHLLVVDDEEMIARLLKRGLEKYGFKVTHFTNSIRAYQAFESDPYAYDLLLTDQTMPHQTGMELSQKVLEIRPDLPVILCTGNDVKLSKDHIHAIGISKLLLKPITPVDLAGEIQRVLSSRAVDEAS